MSTVSAASILETQEPSIRDFDVNRIRRDFPILHQTVNGKPLVYLDNAATSQKPQKVLDTLERVYREYNSNIHRGVHTLSQTATTEYEKVREKVRSFINARSEREIIFLRNTTEAINLVAKCYGPANLKAGDEILITTMEHHSNIVPWQLLCEQTGAVLKIAPINDAGELMLDDYEKLLNEKTKFVSMAHVSNALGTINPVRQIVDLAHACGAKIMLDGAQAAPHLAINVRDLDCDFYTVTGHKMFAPTGIGILFGKHDLLEEMPPYQGGGEMILSVTFEKTVYNKVPHKFEAGTPHIAGAIGLGAAAQYISAIGLDSIASHEHDLLAYGTEKLQEIPGLTLIGTAGNKAAIMSFTLEGVHPHDVGTILDLEGIAVRTGHHCAQPTMERFGITATTRASLALYNTKQDIDALVMGVRKVIEVFG
ncbi:MAG: cysteine desulfurase [Planctomycetes bacterium]|nr:cysteine desulfurase [Planctomycetota bacterium]